MSEPVTRIEYHIISPRYDKDGSVIPYQPGEPVEAEEIIIEELVTQFDGDASTHGRVN